MNEHGEHNIEQKKNMKIVIQVMRIDKVENIGKRA